MPRGNCNHRLENGRLQMGRYKMGHFEMPRFPYSDKITLIYCVENAFNPTSEVQNIENRVFQNALFANGHFPNGDFSCLWAMSSRLNLGVNLSMTLCQIKNNIKLAQNWLNLIYFISRSFRSKPMS